MISLLRVKEFIKHLKCNHAWDKFTKNSYGPAHTVVTKVRTCNLVSPDNQFTWRHSPEGFDYWCELNQQFCLRRSKHYD